MKRAILCVLLSLSLIGCAGLQKPPIPEGCENSLIYPVQQEWIIGAGILKIGVLETIKRNPELRMPILEALGTLKSILGNENLQYTGFAYMVLQDLEQLNEYVSAGSLIVATDIITQTFVQTPLVIDSCDRDLLLRDVTQLEMLVQGL